MPRDGSGRAMSPDLLRDFKSTAKGGHLRAYVSALRGDASRYESHDALEEPSALSFGLGAVRRARLDRPLEPRPPRSSTSCPGSRQRQGGSEERRHCAIIALLGDLSSSADRSLRPRSVGSAPPPSTRYAPSEHRRPTPCCHHRRRTPTRLLRGDSARLSAPAQLGQEVVNDQRDSGRCAMASRDRSAPGILSHSAFPVWRSFSLDSPQSRWACSHGHPGFTALVTGVLACVLRSPLSRACGWLEKIFLGRETSSTTTTTAVVPCPRSPGLLAADPCRPSTRVMASYFLSRLCTHRLPDVRLLPRPPAWVGRGVLG